jgi:putative peptidoglycan lipid II flippase
MLNGRMELSVNASGHRRILSDTVTVGIWMALAKAIGAAKIFVAAHLFGTGDAMDAYLIAFLIPSFIADVLAAPLDTVLVPAFVRRRDREGRGAAEVLYSNILIGGFFVLALLALIVIALSGVLLSLLGSSFSAGKLSFTRLLMLAMLPVVPMSSAWVASRAVLNAEKRFALAAGLPMITPILSIVVLLAAGRRLGVEVLAAATTAGVFLQSAACMWAARRLGFRVRPVWSGAAGILRVVWAQYLPVVSMSLLMGLSALIDQAMAARLGSGSASAFNYGTRLVSVLMSLGPLAIGTAVLPNVSELIAAGARLQAYRILQRYALITTAVGAAVAAVLALASPAIMGVVLAGGRFDEAAIRLVANIQALSLIQLPIAVLLAIGFRLVSAEMANRLLYGIAVASVPLTVLFNIAFMHWMGLPGLAVAASCTRLVTAVYLFCKIRGLRSQSTGECAS